MKKFLGSRRTQESTPTLDVTLMDLEERKWSGCVSILGSPGTLQVFVFEGGAYSCLVDGDPGFGEGDHLVRRRMEVSALDPMSWEPETIVQRGSIHQERLLAFLGPAASASIESCEEGRTTGRNCALPLAWSTVLPVLNAREHRLHSDTRGLIGDSPGGPEVGSLQVVAASRQVTGVCEQDFFLDALTQPTSIDAAAHSCGFSRAEAVHLAAKLHSLGLLDVAATQEFAPQALAVPEAWKPAHAA